MTAPIWAVSDPSPDAKPGTLGAAKEFSLRLKFRMLCSASCRFPRLVTPKTRPRRAGSVALLLLSAMQVKRGSLGSRPEADDEDRHGVHRHRGVYRVRRRAGSGGILRQEQGAEVACRAVTGRSARAGVLEGLLREARRSGAR